MKNISYFVAPLLQSGAAAVFFAAANAGAEAQDFASPPCDIDAVFALGTADLSGMSKSEKVVHGLSAEGAEITYYRQDGQLKAIDADIYGESGKTEIQYRFATDDLKPYWVRRKGYNYSVPFYESAMRVVAESTLEMIVCKRIVPGYSLWPNVKEEHERAKSMLEDLLREQ